MKMFGFFSVKKMQDSSGIYPLECLYLSRNSLQSVIGAQLQPTKHFALQRKPKSAELRADLIQKCKQVFFFYKYL